MYETQLGLLADVNVSLCCLLAPFLCFELETEHFVLHAY